MASQQTGIKKKMGSSKNVLLKRFDELKKSGMGTGRVEFKSIFNLCAIRRKPFFIDLTISKKCIELISFCNVKGKMSTEVYLNILLLH